MSRHRSRVFAIAIACGAIAACQDGATPPAPDLNSDVRNRTRDALDPNAPSPTKKVGERVRQVYESDAPRPLKNSTAPRPAGTMPNLKQRDAKKRAGANVDPPPEPTKSPAGQ